MGTVGFIRKSIKDTEQPIKDSICILLECIEQLRPCGIVGQELGNLASAVELLEDASESLDIKLRELRSLDSNQTSEDYLEEEN